MIKLSIQAYKNACSSLKNYSDKMNVTEETMMASLRTMDPHWTGAPKEKFTQFFDPQFSANGYYHDTMMLVKKTYEAMNSLYPALVEIAFRLENMGEHLHRNDYYPLYTSRDFSSCEPNAYNRGKVYFDSAYINLLNSSVDDAVQYAMEAKNEYLEAINMVSGIINLSCSISEIEDGYRNVCRLKNFKTEMNLIASKVDMFMDEFNSKCNGILSEYGVPSGELIDYQKEAILSEELLKELAEKGFTLDQYRSAVLDSFMYMDIFNPYKNDDFFYDNELISLQIKKIYDNGAITLLDIISLVENEEVYLNPDSDRYAYMQIVKGAIEKDPALGRLQINYMSRLMTDRGYNEGTNGIVFTDPYTRNVYVSFRGTSGGEWPDDGERFSVLSLDDMTIQMKQTIDFFEYAGKEMGWNENSNIIVTGHSQGGNDCQVVTLFSKDMGKYVKACYSFDGEGHSPDLLEYIKNEYGEEEYERRVSKIYSICGEYDFVNHLGEKVAKEENTKYVKCCMRDAIIDCHDIKSMFCSKEGKEYVYTGNINTSVGTESSYVTEYTAVLWEELKELPFEERKACQDALMSIAEKAASGSLFAKGLNGEKAEGWDYYILAVEGLVAIKNSVGITAYHKLYEKVVEKGTTQAIDKLNEMGFFNDAMAEDISIIMNTIYERNIEHFELMKDIDELVRAEIKDVSIQSAINLIPINIDYAFLKKIDIIKEKGEMPISKSKAYLLAEQAMDVLLHDVERTEEVAKVGWDFVVEDYNRTMDFVNSLSEKIERKINETTDSLLESTQKAIEIQLQQQLLTNRVIPNIR